jgi:predicted nucleic acid-binding protein
MASLIESSILARLANAQDAQFRIASNMIRRMHRQGKIGYITPQSLIEFRCVATRPVAVNGLGMTSEQAERRVRGFERRFTLLPENDAIYPAWKKLVKASGVIGKQVHDARLVAVCQVYGMTQVVTFNSQHFARLASFVPNLNVVDPRSIQP